MFVRAIIFVPLVSACCRTYGLCTEDAWPPPKTRAKRTLGRGALDADFLQPLMKLLSYCYSYDNCYSYGNA